MLDDDYYQFDEEKMLLTGEKTGKTYTLGQAVKIRVMAVDLYQKNIDFAIQNTKG